jgi:lipopolysaccharide export LptBFGC system permease protein LptF
MAATLGLVLVVFLAERLTTLLEMLIQRHAPLSDLPWVLTLTAPEILISAMPLALLVGAYRALLEARDGGETVVMACAGVGPAGMMASLMNLGAIAFAVVIFVAGWVDPIARAARDLLYLEAGRQMLVDVVHQGLAPDDIRSLNGYTVVSPGRGDAGGRRLLVFLPREGGNEQIVAATDYELTELEGARRYHLRLRDVTVAELPLAAPPGTTGEGTESTGSGYRLGTLSRDVDLDDALRDPKLPDLPQYRTLGSLIDAAKKALDPVTDKTYGLRAAEIVTRACLTFAAVLMAAIGVSFADGRRRYVALPAVAAAMVAIDLVVVRMVRGFDAASASGGLVQGALATVVLLTVLGIGLTWRYPRVVAPAGGRA